MIKLKVDEEADEANIEKELSEKKEKENTKSRLTQWQRQG